MLRNERFVQGPSKVLSFRTHQSLTGVDEAGNKAVRQASSGLQTPPNPPRRFEGSVHQNNDVDFLEGDAHVRTTAC